MVGKGFRPDPSFSKKSTSLQPELKALQTIVGSGKKIKELDLLTLTSVFEQYTKCVNLLLARMYSDNDRVEILGQSLAEYKGRAYTLLRKEKDLSYQHNDEIKRLVYERLYRNALEHAGRTLLADWTRRQLFLSAIKVLHENPNDIPSFLRRKRIASALVRKVRDDCESTKNNGSGYHHALGVLRQLRFALDKLIMEKKEVKITWRNRQRSFVASLLKKGSSNGPRIHGLVLKKLQEWESQSYPFTTPFLKRYSLDTSASTENSPGQGYWFALDPERENEVLLHLKLPPGIDGTHHETSPYKKRTLTFRFLDWLPSASARDEKKEQRALQKGDDIRAERLRFRRLMFEDMHQQLKNTIKIQHLTYKLISLKQKVGKDAEQIIDMKKRIAELKKARRSAPPRIVFRNGRVILQVPFLAPDGDVLQESIGEKEYTTKAGVDRGLRVPVVLSVMQGKEYRELLLKMEYLVKKREILRKQVYVLQSETDRKKGNWERKRTGQVYPGHILKKDRHIAALWRKVRRLDREIARVVASRTVWFCEQHQVKTVFFEDLRSFQGHAGSKDLSYNLSSNLWGKVIDTVRYMREALGHSKYSVWTVNPRYTSQTCHQCGERGKRVEDTNSTIERKGGEYFYCSECDEHFHADVNAARNIIHVHQ
ncbi:MAG: transposase, partial [Candidatus Thorarchaeota archaeon]|nr:transposase [Candidatus Thorarchaeota archaeon]